jgi:hypothetical protein
LFNRVLIGRLTAKIRPVCGRHFLTAALGVFFTIVRESCCLAGLVCSIRANTCHTAQPLVQEHANVEKNNPESRYISRNIAEEPIDPSFSENAVSTSKYNIVTFLPLFLFEMFSRVAYLYFLIQVRSPTMCKF